MNQIIKLLFYFQLVTTCLAFQNALQSPTIVEHPTDVIVKKNEPATLNCKADGEPPPTIEWYKDGEKVINTSSRLFLADRLFFLKVFQNEDNSDTGTYWCVARNAVGKVRSRNATIGLAYFQTEFRKAPKSVSVISGDPVTIDCTPPRGYPEPAVLWKKDGKTLNSNSSRIKLLPNGSLRISVVRPTDKGKYSCRASNILGSRESLPAVLNVYVKPFFIRPPVNATTLANEKVELECKVEGDPTPSITWTKQNGNIPSQRAVITSSKSLQIIHISLADEGIYNCEAENLGGTVSASASISVYSHPKLTVSPATLTMSTHQEAQMECNSEGSPAPLVFWTTEGSFDLMFPSSSQERYHINSDATLVITDLKKEDQGYYYCTALSITGSAFGHSVLTVTSMETASPPIINFGPFDQFLREDSIAILPCEVSATTPAQIKWLFNGQPLSLNEHRFIVLNSGTLQIDGIKEKDSGVYTCLAMNDNGESLWSGSITVKSPLDSNVIFHSPQTLSEIAQPTSKPSAVNVTETSISLVWSFPDPSSDFKGFTIEYYSSKDPHKWTLASSRIQDEKYTINDLSPATSYIFIVRVENSYGLGLPSPASEEILTLSTFNHNFELELNEARNILISYVIELKEAIAINSTSIKINWQVTGAKLFIDGCIIRYASVQSQTNHFETIVLQNKDQNTLNLTGLKPYSNYQVFVALYYKNIQGPASNLKMVQTLEDVPSSAPAHISIKVINETSVEVTWSMLRSSDWNGLEKGYMVQVESKNFWFKNSFNTSYNSTMMILSDLSLGRLYDVKVAAYTSVGLGPFSEPAPLRMQSGYVYKSSPNLADLIKDTSLTSLSKNPAFIIGTVVFMFLISSLILIIFVRRQLGWKKAVGAYITVQLDKNDKLEKRGTNLPTQPSWLGSDNSKLLLNDKQADSDPSKFMNHIQYYPDEEGYYVEVEGHSLVTFGKTDLAQIEPYATTNLINTFQRDNETLSRDKAIQSRNWTSSLRRENVGDQNRNCFEQLFRDTSSSIESSSVRDSKKFLLSSSNSKNHGHSSSISSKEFDVTNMMSNVAVPPKGLPAGHSACFIKNLKTNLDNTSLFALNHEPIYQRPYSHDYVPSSRVGQTQTGYARTSLLSSPSSNGNSYLSKAKPNESNYQKLSNHKSNLDDQSCFTNHYNSSDVNNLNSVGNVHLIKNPLFVSSIQSSLPSLSSSNLTNDNLIKSSQSKLESGQSLEREEQCFQSDLQNCDNLINQTELNDGIQDCLASNPRPPFRVYQVGQSSGSDYEQISELDEERFVPSLLARHAHSKSQKPDHVFRFNSRSYQEGTTSPSLTADCKKNYSRKSRAKNKRSSKCGHQLIRFMPSINDDYLD